MEKPDISDLYRFFATLGFLLISGAVIVIWVLSNENAVFLIDKGTLESLTDTAQNTINSKQKFLACIYSKKDILFCILLFSGLLSFVYGISKWWNRQEKKDRDEDIKYMENLKKCDEEQNKYRIKKEVNETEGHEPESDVEISAITAYYGIEKTVCGHINKKYSDNYIIKNNIRLIHCEFDIIMYSEKLKCYKAVEIKYYIKDIKYANLENGYIKFALALDEFKEYFKIDDVNAKSIDYILIWVYKDNGRVDILRKNREIMLNRFNNHKIDIKIINENQIDDLVI